MATITFKVTGVCQGGEHITIDTLRNDSVVDTEIFTRTELMDKDTTKRELKVGVMRAAIITSGASTNAQSKTAIESISVTV